MCQRTPEDRKGWRELGMSCWHVARLLQSIQEADLAEKYAGRAVDSAAKARDAALFAATSALYDGLVATRGNKKGASRWFHYALDDVSCFTSIGLFPITASCTDLAN